MSSYDPFSHSQSSSRASSVQADHYFTHASDASPRERLRPEDAAQAPYSSLSLRRCARKSSPLGRSDTITASSATHNLAPPSRSRQKERRGRSGSRRRKRTWKKLLWVKQSYPDNYTDEETFLDHLQFNPKLRPYEFWSLVADSTNIVQHVCSVVIFVCCFTAIFQERVSPQTVVGWATSGTVAGWVLRDWWQTREEAKESGSASSGQTEVVGKDDEERSSTDSTSMAISGKASAETTDFGRPFNEQSGHMRSTDGPSRAHSRRPSATSASGIMPLAPMVSNSDLDAIFAASTVAPPSPIPPYESKQSLFSRRMEERLTTAKSALLIYCSLLGLSPILKSLTKSTSSDSIWALSSWLMILNVFTFDYGAGPEAKFPASLSTNAALMASTVLASRLEGTTSVFSLTLFSIEVFGLFPVFRRHLRHHSWDGHFWLTFALVFMAGGGLMMVVTGGGWLMGVLGAVFGGVVAVLSMGMTSWWLIGLQRYKNEIRGPWDPARPVIRRGWD